MDITEWETRLRRLERQRWVIWGPLALALLIVYFHRVSAGVVADSLMREFNIQHATELGLLSSIYFYTYAILQIPVGILADRLSPRRIIVLSLVVTAGGAFAFGMAQNLSWLYGARFLVGLGVSFIYVNMLRILGEWFRTREFGTVAGMNAFVGNVGSIMAATPLAIMVDSIGWRTSFHATGVITLVAAAICWLVIRDRPVQVGLPSIADIEAKEGTGVPSDQAGQQQSVWGSLCIAVLNRHTWPPVLVSCGVYGVFMAFTGVWGVPYLMQIYDMTRVEAANYLVAAAMGYMLGGPLVGYMSDRFRCRRWPFVLHTAVMLAAWLVLTLWNQGKPPEWALYPLCLIMGAGASGVSLMLVCAREVNPPAITGVAMGLANTGPFVGTALIQPLFGYMLDLRWAGEMAQGVRIYPLAAYEAAFMLCAGVLVLSLIAAVVIKETKCVNVAHLILKNK